MRKLLKTCIPAPEPTYKTFTVRRQEVSSPSDFFLSYSDDAASLSQGDAAFDEFFAYRPVLLDSNGNVTAELNPNNFAKTIDWEDAEISQWDNVMIEFPIRWIKMSKEWDVVTLSITDNPDAEDDWFQYFAHSRWTFDNPIKKNNFYLWAYKGFISVSNQCLQSWSWQNPTWGRYFTDFLAAARRNDDNSWDNWYDIQWFYQRNYLIALYFMKYGNPDSQSVIWLWYTGWSSIPKTWATNTVWMTWVTDSTKLGRVKLFWIEDIWWAAHEFLAWVKTWLEADWFPLYTALSNFNDIVWWDYGWYTNHWAWIALWRQNYNVTKIVWDNYKMFAPAENALNNKYDIYYCNNAQVLANRISIIWQSYNAWKAEGITRIYLGINPTWMSTNNVSRLMYL